MIGDVSEGFERQQEDILNGKTEQEVEQFKALKHSYYLNFPQQNPEKENANLILPVCEQKVHQNSIFDLIWLKDRKRIVTASGD